ncbi:hypothetical protein FFLO_03543 [Filobasidium floriforme]|uniref:Cysteine-rich transmembrane CYSTM domain-containing protein n=1 Tax=Filobasidium floriforme TaxID=5210 RepID=A0A8K0NQP4_9TREE|nr:uncharacterized protein HD553DRAFT_341400 [Filobasidium floriforme]KAG7535945.1 hypothetical protein FFLO_03543 [Filobasidium floriforme]KAH8086549.1 hypothetical protein HD553DRAFT_341400 [Filobasidium floriforme]
MDQQNQYYPQNQGGYPPPGGPYGQGAPQYPQGVYNGQAPYGGPPQSMGYPAPGPQEVVVKKDESGMGCCGTCMACCAGMCACCALDAIF